MKSVDTIIKAKWVIPVEPYHTTLENHCIAIEAGKIVALLPASECEQQFKSANTIELSDHALIPGLINAHTHAAMSLFRGLADDLPLMTWLSDHIWPAETKWVSNEFVVDGAELAIAEMLKSGTTCFCDMYFFPEEVAHAARKAHIRAAIGLIVIDFASAYAQNYDEYLSKGLKLHDELRNEELLSTIFAPHAPYTVSDEPLRRLSTLSEELDIQITMHIHETQHEVDEAVKSKGARPLARLQAMDLLNPRLSAVHMTSLSNEEIDLIASTGVHVIHCPESNLKLASGFCQVHTLIQKQVNVALGTDGAASNNDLDMISEMRTAALLAKGVAGDATALPAHEALRMATINGAKALGLDSKIGSIEPGKDADLVAINLADTATTPVYEAISQIIYAASRDQVTHSWVKGKMLLNNRELTTIDESALHAKANQWRDKIKAADHK
jgi:5-methylthioadenosine/S-adenosylhomocysteine deaminase